MPTLRQTNQQVKWALARGTVTKILLRRAKTIVLHQKIPITYLRCSLIITYMNLVLVIQQTYMLGNAVNILLWSWQRKSPLLLQQLALPVSDYFVLLASYIMTAQAICLKKIPKNFFSRHKIFDYLTLTTSVVFIFVVVQCILMMDWYAILYNYSFSIYNM